MSDLSKDVQFFEALIDVIATQIAKRDHGPRYEGYESSQREAAEVYASAAMGVMAAFGYGPFSAALAKAN